MKKILAVVFAVLCVSLNLAAQNTAGFKTAQNNVFISSELFLGNVKLEDGKNKLADVGFGYFVKDKENDKEVWKGPFDEEGSKNYTPSYLKNSDKPGASVISAQVKELSGGFIITNLSPAVTKIEFKEEGGAVMFKVYVNYKKEVLTYSTKGILEKPKVRGRDEVLGGEKRSARGF